MSMLTKVEQYLANANTCQRMADRLARDEDKAVWLDLAQSWLLLTYPKDDFRKGQFGPAGDRLPTPTLRYLRSIRGITCANR